MKIYVTKTASVGFNPQEGEFYFKYDQDYYTEIVNARAYSFETLLGQVGGFVGKYNWIVRREGVIKRNNTKYVNYDWYINFNMFQEFFLDTPYLSS